MVSGANKKLKVVWICHFTNEEVQKALCPIRRVNEYSAWISLGIEEVAKRDDIELHVVSPHRYISGVEHFVLQGIHYHFYNSGMPFVGRGWSGKFRFDLWTDFYWNKLYVKRIVESIDPHVIHLHGLENDYYSSTSLQFIGKYPFLATIQGFIRLQSSAAETDKNILSRIDVELQLLQQATHFGVRTEAMKVEILKHNPKAKLWWHEYFLNEPDENSLKLDWAEKSTDLIFFARLDKAKGVEDVIKAAEILKKDLPNIAVAIIGSGSKAYEGYLKELAVAHNCAENIRFLGFLPTQNDIYKYLNASKACIIPTYNDIIPGTIIESMLRKVPVVSYKTGGIPDLNNEKELVLLADQGDIATLAANAYKLLTDKALNERLSSEAYTYAKARWSNKKAMDDIMTIYKSII